MATKEQLEAFSRGFTLKNRVKQAAINKRNLEEREEEKKRQAELRRKNGDVKK